MRKHSRNLAACVAVIMAAASLTACGGGSSEGGGKKLHVFIGSKAEYPQEHKAWMKRIKKKFKARTGADITFETFSSPDQEQTKIQTSAVSGQGPDVYQIGTTFTPVAHATKAFHKLTPEDWKKLGGRDRFIPQSLTMSGPNPENEIGVPTGMRPYGMVYNKAMFEKAGIKSPPKTWDEFLSYAKRLNKPKDGVYGTALEFGDDFSPWKYIWSLTLQSGGGFINDDLTKSQLDSPKTQEAVESLFELHTEHKVVDPKSVGWEAAQSLSAFSSGKAAMLGMVTPGAVPTLEESKVKDDYAFAPMPLVPFGEKQRPAGGKPAGTIVSGDDLAIADYSENTDLALEYIALVTSPEEQKHYSELFGELPTDEQAAREMAKDDPQVAAFLKAEETALPTSFTGAWADVQLGLGNVITQSRPALARGTYDPAEVKKLLAQADKTVQSSIDRQKR